MDDRASSERHGSLTGDRTGSEMTEDELREQRDRIAELVEGQHLLRWQRERMTAVLPVPVLMTDHEGIVQTVNAAAAQLLGTRVARLVGRSVTDMVSAGDRTAVEERLRELAAGGASIGRTVTLEPPAAVPVEVELFVHRPAGPAPEISWMLLAAGSDAHEGRPRVMGVAAALSELALLPLTVAEEQPALTRAAEICARGLGPGASVSLVLGEPGEPTAVASTSTAAQQLDGAQLAAGTGPSVTAYDEAVAVEAPDLRTDERWPRLGPDVPPEVVGVVAAPLEVGDKLAGVLTVSIGEAAWPDALLEDVELLAVTVAGVLLELGLKQELRTVLSELEQALTSRATIDQAKGIVMAQRRVGPEAAFQHLAELSSTQHVKLRDLAEEMVRRAAGG